jgi:hypothetical protein
MEIVRRAAVVAANAQMDEIARRLFRRAVKRAKAQPDSRELEEIARDQANVGHVDDALQTAGLMTHAHLARVDEFEAVLLAIAKAQLAAMYFSTFSSLPIVQLSLV